MVQRTLTGITGTFTTASGYNYKGDMTQMTYPSGRVVNFNIATGGGCCNSRLASVVDQTTGTTIANSISYNSLVLANVHRNIPPGRIMPVFTLGATYSKAPISQAAPWGRETPRSSVVTGFPLTFVQ